MSYILKKLSMFFITIIILILMTLDAQANNEINHLKVSLDNSIYQVYVTEDTDTNSIEKNGLPTRNFRISCQIKCNANLSYEEKLSDGLISVFRMSDASPFIISLWVSGSAMWVRVYYIGEGTIEKVLEQGTKLSPQFGCSPDGVPVIILREPFDHNIGSFQAMGNVWKWNGAKYQEIKSTR